MNNYIKIYLVLVCLFALPVYGNGIPEKWEPGVIHLDGESIHGEVNYNPKMEVVFCKKDGRIQTFSAHTVQHFEIYDKEAELIRIFSSMDAEGMGFQTKKVFYEIVVEGNLTLLRKGMPARKPRPSGKYHRVQNRIAEAKQKAEIVYSYYVYQDDAIKEIKHIRKQVLPLMHEQQGEMHQFIETNNLDLNKPQSLVLLSPE